MTNEYQAELNNILNNCEVEIKRIGIPESDLSRAYSDYARLEHNELTWSKQYNDCSFDRRRKYQIRAEVMSTIHFLIEYISLAFVLKNSNDYKLLNDVKMAIYKRQDELEVASYVEND